jgi:hypothetical protein
MLRLLAAVCIFLVLSHFITPLGGLIVAALAFIYLQ